MAILKCKMCGGDINLPLDKTFGTCEFCGNTTTLPKIDDDQRAAAFNRGNHFRRIGEFDKALAVYERIVQEDNTDAEAHWCCALCRFGIEYVEDPATYEWIPTCHRASFDSFIEDVDYKAALEYSEGITQRQYMKDGAKIAEVQKGILITSQNAEPYDVFICYKESDEKGERTRDSLMAQEIYYQLVEQGRKVFFARITLEDVVGTQYEPYIFAALNSAKVMIVVGSKPEYLNAVWVKNEWSRFLAMMKKDRQKLLLPCYKDMDPYDLPEQLSVLQSYDMSKIGFIQDLIRGIAKVLDNDKKNEKSHETVIVQPSAETNIAPLLKRAFMFLEDENWESADEYCEKVLDIDPENASAYLGKLLSELRVSKQVYLKDQAEPFDGNNNYPKVIRFADEKLKETLIGYIEHINARNENSRLDGIYSNAKNVMSVANTENAYKEAAHLFEIVSDYLDSAVLAQTCYEKAEIARKDTILSVGKEKMTGEVVSNYEAAIKLFESISGWKDADEKVSVCQKKIEEIKVKVEADRLESAKRKKKIVIITIPIICAIITFAILLNSVIIPNGKYDDALALMNAGDYIEAYESLIALDGYKDSGDKANSIFDKYKTEKLKSATVGDSVFFGSYEQDNNTSNGKENIEWLVLEVKNGRALLLSKYGLDYQKYNEELVDITWETCTLRKWLNDTFLNTAFSKKEKDMISTVTVSADRNPVYDSHPGNSTQDRIFLLSIAEVEKYFSSDDERVCETTVYAKEKSAYKGACWWWLRSPGITNSGVAGVDCGDGVDDVGHLAVYVHGAVRPALWIDLNF